MPAAIATYFFDELEDWGHSIDVCREEIAVLNERLADIIRRNSISDIAGKVESQQASLDKVTRLFHNLELEIQQQETALHAADSNTDEDKRTGQAIVQNQDVLRRNMQAAEKEFVDVKYNCHHFLSHVYKA